MGIVGLVILAFLVTPFSVSVAGEKKEKYPIFKVEEQKLVPATMADVNTAEWACVRMQTGKEGIERLLSSFPDQMFSDGDTFTILLSNLVIHCNAPKETAE